MRYPRNNPYILNLSVGATVDTLMHSFKQEKRLSISNLRSNTSQMLTFELRLSLIGYVFKGIFPTYFWKCCTLKAIFLILWVFLSFRKFFQKYIIFYKYVGIWLEVGQILSQWLILDQKNTDENKDIFWGFLCVRPEMSLKCS